MAPTGLLGSAIVVPMVTTADVLVSPAATPVVTMPCQLASARPAPLPPVMSGGTRGMVTAAMAAAVPTASLGDAGTSPTNHGQRHHDSAQNDCNPASHDSLPLLEKNVKPWATWYLLCAPADGSSVAKAG
jgi:hypothetical protein